eukprot:m.36448 g.36448  ORF g.36448 m.36448 type:complete len:285 (-) comp7574_c0_seq1:66-920(-)
MYPRSMTSVQLVLAAACVAVGLAAPLATCPPAGFDTQGALEGGFDIDWYANGTWYIQQQMTISYLPSGFTYCVAATYTQLDKPTTLGYTVNVHNHAVRIFMSSCHVPHLSCPAQNRTHSRSTAPRSLTLTLTHVGAPLSFVSIRHRWHSRARERRLTATTPLQENSTGQQPAGSKDICAKVVNATAGKLEVAPCFLPPSLSGPYWVVAFSKEEGWALVSGGPPKETGANGCKTGTGVNGSGLWIFTRFQERNEGLVTKIRGIAAAKGFDLSVLNDVDQSHCSNN